MPRYFRQRGPLVVGRIGRIGIRPDAEHVVAEVGQHPKVVVFGDAVAGEQEDVHRSRTTASPSQPHMTLWTVWLSPLSGSTSTCSPTRGTVGQSTSLVRSGPGT